MSSVLKNIRIHLTGPICNCTKQDIGWGIVNCADGRSTLFLVCNLCKQQIRIAPDDFKASFKLDTPYPAVEERLDDGTVIDTSDSFFKLLERQMKEK